MARVRLGKVRSIVASSAAVAVLAVPVAAAAQTPAPEPVITSSPRAVGFRDGAVIVGRLENGAPGQVVYLQRRRSSARWQRIAERVTDENSRVRFRLGELRTSAGYRLLFVDEATGDKVVSGARRIEVGVRLRLHTSKTHLIAGRRLRIFGTLYPKIPGRRVLLAQKVGGSWRRIGREWAGDGAFSTYFRPSDRGYRRLRVRFAGDDLNRASADRRPIRVYQPSLATWYGPGLYGNRTACGQRLGYGTLGVAHRSLPCGTDVNILYEGRTITVPVIDRGPYSSAEWDLTRETAERLRFSGKDRIGTER